MRNVKNNNILNNLILLKIYKEILIAFFIFNCIALNTFRAFLSLKYNLILIFLIIIVQLKISLNICINTLSEQVPHL